MSGGANFMPPSLLMMFQARPPLPFIPPKPPANLPPYSGLSGFLKEFSNPADDPPFKKEHIETVQEKRDKKRKLRESENQERNQKLLKTWDPYSNEKATGDPYKTLFVGRISYQTSESKLKHEFSQYGPIKKIRLIHDSVSGKPRGFAFIEFEKERDMKTAYKQADGKKIDDKRILVDIERGRVIKNWKPRKLGGGLGNTRAGGADVNQTFSGRELSEQREREKEREKEKERDSKRYRSDGSGGSSRGGDRYGSGGGGGGRDYRDDRDRDRRGGGGGDRDRDRDRDRGYSRDDRGGRDYDRGGRDRDRDRRDDRDRGGRDRDRGDYHSSRDHDRGDRGGRDNDRDYNGRERERDGASNSGGGNEPPYRF
eukprot:gene8047-9896_t